jgi:hypothetical protein
MQEWNPTATDEERRVVNELMRMLEDMHEKPSVDTLEHF